MLVIGGWWWNIGWFLIILTHLYDILNISLYLYFADVILIKDASGLIHKQWWANKSSFRCTLRRKHDVVVLLSPLLTLLVNFKSFDLRMTIINCFVLFFNSQIGSFDILGQYSDMKRRVIPWKSSKRGVCKCL